jgi:hypothetical protein
MDQADWWWPGQQAVLQQENGALRHESGVGQIHHTADVKQTVVMQRPLPKPSA